MCSVVGYVGKPRCRTIICEGLTRLEYRGYDSAGFACIGSDGRLLYQKAPGKLKCLMQLLSENPIDGGIGIGHTRWSTHGHSTTENAHPHFDCEKKVAIVHNGIIENYQMLRDQLIAAGHVFHSHTDTEVIAHQLEALCEQYGDLKPAICALVSQLEGAYACAILLEEYPECLVAIRKRSPLCVGIGEGEAFVASDMMAFAGKTDRVLFVPDESIAVVKKDEVELYDFFGVPLEVQPVTMQMEWKTLEKEQHEHYMLKEIYEQKAAIHDTVDFLDSISTQVWEHMGLEQAAVAQLERLNIIGCGTSWHAARIAQFFFESVALLPTRIHLGSEFRYMPFFPEVNSMHMFVSQSGETADTLEAMRMVASMNQSTVALTNVSSSTLVREADGFLLTQAGREVAVASTKAFTTQIAALYWLAHRIAVERRIIPWQRLHQAEEDLLVAAEVLENCIENYKYEIAQTVAPRYAAYKQAIFLGRHVGYPFAMEAALKLKELAYVFAQCYPAGELKHGPLALVDEHTPVYLFSHQAQLMYQKIVSNAQEIKARGGHLVGFLFEGQQELHDLCDTAFVVPRIQALLGPLAQAGLMQFFVYSIARELGCPIDKPRNLAKSVTVE